MEDNSLLQNIRRTPTLSTPILVISKLFMAVLPIAQMAIGGVYLNNCPQQRYIPIYLLVSGAFALFLAVMSCLPCSQESETQSPASRICAAWNSLVSLFLFCWFVTGNVWIYSIYPANYNEGDPLYCNKTLYLFAFWTTTLVYIFLGVAMVAGCCVMIFMCLCGRSGTSTDDV